MQDVREGKRHLANGYNIYKDLLKDIKSRGAGVDPQTIAGHLLRIKDPKTGKPLADEYLIPEIGIVFLAGVKHTYNTVPKHVVVPPFLIRLIWRDRCNALRLPNVLLTCCASTACWFMKSRWKPVSHAAHKSFSGIPRRLNVYLHFALALPT
jgi:hypothetical protein